MALNDAQYGDIRATLAVSQDEARSGSRRVINLPGGRAVAVTVPSGVQDGEEIRLPGQGEASGPGGQAGDLILRIAVIATNKRLEDQYWTNSAMPTSAMQQSFLPSATQAPTEYVADRSAYPPPPAAAPYPNSFPTEAMSSNAVYQSAAPVVPQTYPGYGESPQHQAYAPWEATIPPPLPKKRSGLVIVLVLLIVLVLVIGGGSLYYIGYYQPNQIQSAANATAQVQATSTAQIVQATAQVAATSTAQAQATVQAHQALYTQATTGTLTLNDSLNSQSGSQWEEFTSTVNGTCGFSGGSYHASIPKATFFQPCFARTPIFSNFALQVDMTIIQGDEGGIIFRADEANDKFYLLSVSTSGAYHLFLYVSNQGSQAQTLLNGQSNLILPAGQRNEITVVAQGSQLSFYFNKQYVNSIADATYTSGMIGVFSESRTQPTEAAFSNMKVWTL